MIQDIDMNAWEQDQNNQYESGYFNKISNPNSLHQSFLKCRTNVNWKGSVQKYGLNELSNIVNSHDNLENRTYKMSEPYEFTINERGHKRYIKAHTITDRVIQRSFNDNSLNPAIKNRLIFDNGASQKGKGISFSRDRFKHHLQSSFYEFGYNGYILLIDFSKYFDNIVHSEILKQFYGILTPAEYEFVEMVFHSFDIDVSYMSDEEYLTCKDDLFNLLEYCKIDKELLTGDKMMEKSVGIGNQTSQATGIYYPHEIDNYCKIVLGLKYYGRYMDDTYIIKQTPEELYKILDDIETICNKLGIHINKKKTRIQPLYTIIPYLKINYKIMENGRILELVPNVTFKREKNRIDAFHRLMMDGKMKFVDILQCYLSWYGSYKKFDSKRKLYALDQYFRQTFNIATNIDDLHDIFRFLYKQEYSNKNYNNFY